VSPPLLLAPGALARATRGVVFYATPHFGSRLADLGWRLRRLPGAGAIPAPAVEHLAPGPHLVELNERLRRLLLPGEGRGGGGAAGGEEEEEEEKEGEEGGGGGGARDDDGDVAKERVLSFVEGRPTVLLGWGGGGGGGRGAAAAPKAAAAAGEAAGPAPAAPHPAGAVAASAPTVSASIVVVPFESAFPGYGAVRVLPRADHVGVCKPASRADEAYAAALAFLRAARRRAAGAAGGGGGGWQRGRRSGGGGGGEGAAGDEDSEAAA
jgi:hypothetical protein